MDIILLIKHVKNAIQYVLHVMEDWVLIVCPVKLLYFYKQTLV